MVAHCTPLWSASMPSILVIRRERDNRSQCDCDLSRLVSRFQSASFVLHMHKVV